VAALCREAGAIFIVNDRADFAMLLGAGLHLGQDDLPPAEARGLWSLAGQTIEPVIGFSTHNPDQLRAAGAEPVDYLALGPVFATASKENPDPVVGIDKLREVRAGVNKPLVAIGGITLENAAEALRAGADSVAVIAAMLPNPCTPQTIRQRMEEWNQLATAVS
jgi:thiamine-phosphate pyrophosphorylase